MIDKCKNCEKDFNKKHKRHCFCCVECKRSYYKTHSNNTRIYVCDNCGNAFETTQYRKGKHIFCCYECLVNFVVKNTNNIKVCEYCGKELELKRWEKLRFCSTKCQNKWQSEVYAKRPDVIARKRKEMVEKIHNGYMKNSQTKPCLIIENLLNKNDIRFDIEVPYGNFVGDIFLHNNLYIEIMGDYWHSNPTTIYSKTFTTQQINTTKRDKRKYDYINNSNIYVLFLWEYDIITELNKCEALIKYFINQNGKLSNYESYNYRYTNNILSLRDDIIDRF